MSKRFRYKARDAAKGPSLCKECNAVAEPFGHNPEGSGHLAPIAALQRLALEAHWPERDPRSY